jgi:cytidine deaminase
MNNMNYEELAKLAIKAKGIALPPYSNFHVGAALLTREGKVYLGGNIETSSYSLTICAERTAVFKAISEGDREFTAIAIASDSPDFCPPCGSCRQVLSDLCGNIDVVLVNHNEEIKVLKMTELLPYAFSDIDLKK